MRLLALVNKDDPVLIIMIISFDIKSPIPNLPEPNIKEIINIRTIIRPPKSSPHKICFCPKYFDKTKDDIATDK